MKFLLTDIVWDKEADGEIQEVDLPKTLTVTASSLDHAFNVASDEWGFCIVEACVERVA